MIKIRVKSRRKRNRNIKVFNCYSKDYVLQWICFEVRNVTCQHWHGDVQFKCNCCSVGSQPAPGLWYRAQPKMLSPSWAYRAKFWERRAHIFQQTGVMFGLSCQPLELSVGTDRLVAVRWLMSAPTNWVCTVDSLQPSQLYQYWLPSFIPAFIQSDFSPRGFFGNLSIYLWYLSMCCIQPAKTSYYIHASWCVLFISIFNSSL